MSVGLRKITLCKKKKKKSLRSICDRIQLDKLQFTTFLLVKPDVPCAVIVCWAAHGVVLRYEVLEFLCDDYGFSNRRIRMYHGDVYLSV